MSAPLSKSCAAAVGVASPWRAWSIASPSVRSVAGAWIGKMSCGALRHGVSELHWIAPRREGGIIETWCFASPLWVSSDRKGGWFMRRATRSEINQAEQSRCDAFNAVAPVGTRVRFWPGGRVVGAMSSSVKSPAFVVGNSAVVNLTGVYGMIPLEHVAVVGVLEEKGPVHVQ